jgi:hypothetical protein
MGSDPDPAKKVWIRFPNNNKNYDFITGIVQIRGNVPVLQNFRHKNLHSSQASFNK